MRRLAGKGSLLLCAILAATPVATTPARAEEDATEACAAAGEQGQLLRIKGKFLEARTKYLECVRDTCPTLVQKDCAQFLSELEAATPSIVLAAHDERGADLTEVRVLVDGSKLVDRLDGKSVPIDPGAHAFRFEAEGTPVVEKSFVVREGEKNRVILVTLATPPKTATVAATPTAAWIALGVGTVFLGSFAYFGLSARHDFDSLRASCGGSCASADVDSVKRKALVADLSLGASAISFGLATWLLLSRPEAPRTGTLDLLVGIGRQGGSLALLGTF